MDLIKKIVKEIIESKSTLNEEFRGNDFYVYHVAQENTLNSIFKFGFEAFYTASKVGNAYGRGVYSTFSLESSVSNAHRGEYGRIILRCRVKSLRSFLIWDEEIAKKVYGGHWRIESQLALILSPKCFQKLKNGNAIPGSHFWSDGSSDAFTQMINSKDYTSRNAHVADWYTKYDKDFESVVKGYIFKGPHDGDVAVIRDFKNVYPVEYSQDYGRTWKHIQEDVKFKDYVLNDVDLKLEVGRYYDEVPFHFDNGFAKVMKNGKYNYIYKETYKKGTISPIWFDDGASTFSGKGDCLVIYQGQKYILHFKKDSKEFFVLDMDKSFICYLNDLEEYVNRAEDEEDTW